MDKTVHRISELAAPETAAPEPAAVRRVESASLFQRGREVVIVHHGQEYRLRITKSDKLILTK
ncbi:MAG TPA: hemin uptake protein HemP [Methylomirabilota bacterium]|nr:hemin uptake protein HemP [Methylomirabilota bacterium]